MYFFIGLGLFGPWTHGKPGVAPFSILASGIAAAGHFSLHVQESSKCYGPNMRKVTPGSHALHQLGNHTFQHTSTHILGPHASFGGIPVLRRSFPSENGGMWAPAGLPPRFLRARFHQCTFS